MVAPTYTFIGFNYSMQNLPHHRTEIAYRLARQIKDLVGKGERNEVFIINFAEIYSNTEFLSTQRGSPVKS